MQKYVFLIYLVVNRCYKIYSAVHNATFVINKILSLHVSNMHIGIHWQHMRVTVQTNLIIQNAISLFFKNTHYEHFLKQFWMLSIVADMQ